MTMHHRSLGFRVSDPYPLHLPDADSPTLYLTGRMQITDGQDTLCEWSEQDVRGAVRDFQRQTRMALGEYAYLDVFYSDAEQVQLVIWEDGRAHPTHIVELAEIEFFAAVDDLRAALAEIT